MQAAGILIAAALLTTACATTHGIDRSGAPQDAAVRAAVERLVQADNARDLQGVLSVYADDVVWLPPSGEVLDGKNAIRPRYESLFRDFSIDLACEVLEARADGKLGFARGTTQGTLWPIDGGAPVQVHDKFVALLRYERGAWRVTHLMWGPRDSHPDA